MANDLPDAPSEGAEFPGPYGWPKLPPGLVGLPGSKCFGKFDTSTGQACYVTVGSVAWSRWLDMQAPKQRIIGRGARADRDPVASVLDVSVMPSERPELSIDADPVGAVTGMLDPMPKEYANDPKSGVVPVGEPVDNCMTCRAWNFPSRMASKLFPAGPVSESVAVVMRWLPWVFWGGLGWWLWRKARA